MTPAESAEARRLLKYLTQKVRRYADATLEGKGIFPAKFYMFGAMQEAEDFLYTTRSRREKWLQKLSSFLPKRKSSQS